MAPLCDRIVISAVPFVCARVERAPTRPGKAELCVAGLLAHSFAQFRCNETSIRTMVAEEYLEFLVV